MIEGYVEDEERSSHGDEYVHILHKNPRYSVSVAEQLSTVKD